jgi:hypothetical protein
MLRSDQDLCVLFLSISPPTSRLGEGLTIPHLKKTACYEVVHRVLELQGTCEHGNEPSGSIKGRKCLD